MANNSEITYVFSIDITRIYADGHEEGLDDMQAAKRFDTEEEAVAVAKSIADSYKDDKDVVQVYVRAEMTDGDDYGEPFTIFTASSKDRVATAPDSFFTIFIHRLSSAVPAPLVIASCVLDKPERYRITHYLCQICPCRLTHGRGFLFSSKKN